MVFSSSQAVAMFHLGGPAVFIVPRVSSAEAEGNLERHRKFAMIRVITSSIDDVTVECTREQSRTRARRITMYEPEE